MIPDILDHAGYWAELGGFLDAVGVGTVRDGYAVSLRGREGSSAPETGWAAGMERLEFDTYAARTFEIAKSLAKDDCSRTRDLSVESTPDEVDTGRHRCPLVVISVPLVRNGAGLVPAGSQALHSSYRCIEDIDLEVRICFLQFRPAASSAASESR